MFYNQLRGGDGEAARQIWLRYFPRLSGLARRVLNGRRLPHTDEDAVQNAFAKFFQRVERGEYRNGLHRDDLWRLLSMMTTQAARKLTIREEAQKRGGGNVRTEADIARVDLHGANLDAMFGSVSTAECDMICEELLCQLSIDLREIVILRLAGHSNSEIKSLLNCSLRSIERRLQLVRAIWEEHTL
ncbi:MAG TPA: ECF-type sigma factor [Pirellulaceae bacterium]